MKYVVTVKTPCTMEVEVEADSVTDAKSKAREGDYEPRTEWEPTSYAGMTAVDARPA